MSTNHHGLTSHVYPSQTVSEHELREKWNAQAGEFNQWDRLCLSDQLAWAQTCAIAADRAQGAPRDLPTPPVLEAPAVEVTEHATTIRYEFKVLDENGLIEASGDAATWEEVEREGMHHLARYQKYGPCTLDLRMVVVPVAGPVPAPAVAEAPLWRVMHQASADTKAAYYGFASSDRVIAAEIRALRDWLLPEDRPRPGISWPMERAAWDARQVIRALLTTEADRAERGE